MTYKKEEDEISRAIIKIGKEYNRIPCSTWEVYYLENKGYILLTPNLTTYAEIEKYSFIRTAVYVLYSISLKFTEIKKFIQ